MKRLGLRGLLVLLAPLAVGLGLGCAYVANIEGANPNCDNGVHDPGEGGGPDRIDCGGVCIGKCEGEACSGDANCASDICGKDSRCKGSSCDDGAWNGQETDFNCGGPACRRCDDGKHCKEDSDCLSAACDAAEGTCTPSSCTNQAMDQGEEGPDCGGPARCAACDGASCARRGDCQSGSCVNGACRPVSCTAEPTSDACGAQGECGKCWGSACSSATDCWSGHCDGAKCQPP